MSSDDTVIDVGSWFATLARNWWVIVGLVVLGVVAGAGATLAQSAYYTATASAYIGQTTDANGTVMAGLNSNARAAVQLLASQVVLDEAAKKVGGNMTAGKLRRATTVETPSSVVKTSTSVVNIVVINVTDTDKKRAAAAANALAEVLLEYIESGVTDKIALLEEQLAANQKEYDTTTARSASAQESLDAIARGGGSNAERATVAAPYLAIVQAAATELESLSAIIQKNQMQLLVAKQVEQPRILHEAAVPDAPSGPSMTMNVAVGALAGLVIGIIVAFARQRLAERRAASAEKATKTESPAAG